MPLSFGSVGVTDIDDFDASMFRNANFVFTPPKELKGGLSDVTIVLAGVVENDIKYGQMS